MTMKTAMLWILTSMFVAASALATAAVDNQKAKVSKDPDFSDAFRSDTTLKFMRVHRQPALKDLQKGPNYESDKAQKAADKASDAQNAQEKAAPKEVNPLEQVSDAVNDVFEDAQQGPNADSKKAQKAAAKASKDQQKQKENTPQEANPIDDAGEAADDALADAGKGPNADSKKAQKAAAKQADQHKEQSENAPKEEHPLDQANKDIADGLKDLQQGPNYGKKEQSPGQKGKKEAKGVSKDSTCKNQRVEITPKNQEGNDWADSKGNDCEDYHEGEWCNRHGGYGDAWLDDWGKFEDRANNGKTALDACCVCGGGDREFEAVAAGPAAAGAPAGAPAGPILGTKAGRPLQEQGYSGELVAHEDQSTMTEDWGAEFGPQAGHRDIKTICAEKPGNEWCSLHGYYDKERSAAASTSMAAIVVAMLLACSQYY